MNNIQNINPNLASTLATQAGEAQESKTNASQEVSPLLDGPSVTVSHAPASDLEKLVARLKDENDERKVAMTKQRLASVLEAYTARFGTLSAQQTANLEGIAANNDAIDAKTAELEKVQAEMAAAKGKSTVMQAQIESLERAVAQAVEDGKIHRENVAKLKEQIAADAENEDLKAELEKETAALENSEKALGTAQADLAKAQADAGALSAQIASLAGSAEKLESEIAALEADNAKRVAELGSQTVSNLLAALDDVAPADATERAPTPAEEEKAEQKALANDPANLLREAMDRMDASILRTIDENMDKTV